MEEVQYICRGKAYRVVPIVDVEDIGIDVLEVEALIEDESVDMEVYKSAMIQSIEQGLAFRILVDDEKSGFVYSYMDEYKYIGASINLHGDIVGTLIGLRTIFEIQDSHKILVVPHENGLKNFVSMATGKSIRAYHSVGQPIVVLRNDVVEKGKKMFKYLGIENG